MSTQTWVTVIVAGQQGAGKSTFIDTLSDGILNDTTPSNEPAFDAGFVEIDPNLMLKLVGQPGTHHYNFDWSINKKRNLMGYVLMLDGTTANLEEAHHLVQTFSKFAIKPVVMVVNKQDHPDAISPDEFWEALDKPEGISLLPCIATDEASVKAVIKALMYAVYSGR